MNSAAGSLAMSSTPPPSISTCLQLMEEHGMLDHIRGHSLTVARVAERVLARLGGLERNSDLPSPRLVVAGALLHDIAKTSCLDSGCDHAETGAAICLQLGYDDIAEIVGEHVRLLHFAEDRYQKGHFFAKELIFYADKRVVHTAIVSLEKRLDYILEKYGHDSPKRHHLIRQNFQRCRDLESWLCKKARCDAEELVAEINVPSLLGETP